MKKNIPTIKIERNKKMYQMYLEDIPIHPDRLFPRLIEMGPAMIYVQIYKNERLYWEAYYPIEDSAYIEDIVWKAFRFKL